MSPKTTKESRMMMLIRTEVASAISLHMAKHHRPKNPSCPECGGPLLISVQPAGESKPDGEVHIRCPAPGCDYQYNLCA